MPPPLCRILYVEDEPDIRAIAQMALETVGGFTVMHGLMREGRREPVLYSTLNHARTIGAGQLTGGPTKADKA